MNHNRAYISYNTIYQAHLKDFMFASVEKE